MAKGNSFILEQMSQETMLRIGYWSEESWARWKDNEEAECQNDANTVNIHLGFAAILNHRLQKCYELTNGGSMSTRASISSFSKHRCVPLLCPPFVQS
jgi:hypothetical protein